MWFITAPTLQWDIKLIVRMQLHYTMYLNALKYPTAFAGVILWQAQSIMPSDLSCQFCHRKALINGKPCSFRLQLGEYGSINTSLHSMSGWVWDETYWEKRTYMIHLQQADEFLLHGEYDSYQVQGHCRVQDMGLWVVAKFPSDGVTRECNNVPQAPARTPQISH